VKCRHCRQRRATSNLRILRNGEQVRRVRVCGNCALQALERVAFWTARVIVPASR
jgi:protein-arginine kinase activator protein McsA